MMKHERILYDDEDKIKILYDKVEIKRNLKVPPKLFKEILEEYWNTYGRFGIHFETFDSLKEKDRTVMVDTLRMSTICTDRNSLCGIIIKIDLDDEADVYYSTVRSYSCDKFNPTGYFVARMLGHFSKVNIDGEIVEKVDRGRVLVLDYINERSKNHEI